MPDTIDNIIVPKGTPTKCTKLLLPALIRSMHSLPESQTFV